MEAERKANRLGRETSPYLLQHADNPVDWYPWGPESLEKARREDKPIFLSIGYSACHWCHVMAHESFENPETARLMNEHFVNVKVDREERPDIDAVYMKAVIEMTGQGGWPLSVFLTPEQEPYFGGTYFPPVRQYNRPGFPEILQQAHGLYQNQKEDLKARAQTLLEKLDREQTAASSTGFSFHEMIDRSAAAMAEKFDSQYGGFGSGMKFPEPMHYGLLLRHWFRTESAESVEVVDRSLTKMAEGGMYDQLGGGFHRYSTDRQWLVPHFEKMLYDNALLAKLFLDAFQAFKQDIYENIPRGLFAYVTREMASPEGAFYSSQDADTKGDEGKFYTWELKEILQLLGPRHAKIFARAYGMTSAGNMERKNILHVKDSMETIAEEENVPIFEVQHILKNGKKTLFEAREKRVKPGRDEKILTGWNGLMITAFAKGYAVLRDPDYLKAARRSADFLWAKLWIETKLLRVHKDGESRIDGCLEDYAYYLEALVTLYESTFESVWIERALPVAEKMIEEFWDAEGGGFFMTGKSGERLVARLKNPEDEAGPSANAVAALSLLRLGHLTGKKAYLEKGEGTVRAFQPQMEQNPAAFSGLLAAADFLSSPPTEVVFAGDKDHPEFEKMFAAAQEDFRPNMILIWGGDEKSKQLFPLAEGKSAIKGEPVVYVCKDETCHPPVTTAQALSKLLGSPPEIRLNIFDEEKKAAEIQTQESSNFLGVMSEIFKHSGLK
ncbi:MAG: thioredoxin domain-containing protein [Nitrospinaceae bacterium]